MKTITVEQRPGYTWTPLRNDEVELLKLARSLGIETLRAVAQGSLAAAALAARVPAPAPQPETVHVRPVQAVFPSGQATRWGYRDQRGQLHLVAGEPAGR